LKLLFIIDRIYEPFGKDKTNQPHIYVLIFTTVAETRDQKPAIEIIKTKELRNPADLRKKKLTVQISAGTSIIMDKEQNQA